MYVLLFVLYFLIFSWHSFYVLFSYLLFYVFGCLFSYTLLFVFFISFIFRISVTTTLYTSYETTGVACVFLCLFYYMLFDFFLFCYFFICVCTVFLSFPLSYILFDVFCFCPYLLYWYFNTTLTLTHLHFTRTHIIPHD